MHNQQQYPGPPQPMSPVHDQAVPQKRKNPLGVASICVAVLTMIAIPILPYFWGKSDDNPYAALNAPFYIALPGFLVSLVLSICGLFSKTSNRWPAILGTVLSFLILPVGIVLLFIVALLLSYK
ncbi:MAG: hypothetical protein Q4C71_05030 [Microbacteriaceae bacterium]|nr:hypothetical protein [Microbacteriaceae bacterium]